MADIIQNEKTTASINQEDKKQTLIQLRELVKENAELSKYRVDDDYLLQFLYWTSFDVLSAIQKIKKFQYNLIKYSAWYAAKPPLEVKNMLEKNAICLLDSRDKEGRAIFVIKLANWDPSECIEEYSALLELLVDFAHMQAKTSENGVSVLLDLESIPWSIVTWFTPRNITLAIKLINEYPCKEIKIHLVKSSFLFNTTKSVLWPILPENIKEMIHIHYNDWSSLHEYFNSEELPYEYGGTGPDIDFDYYTEKLYDHNEEINDRLQYRKAILTD